MAVASESATIVGIKPICEALGVPRSSFYRTKGRLSSKAAQERSIESRSEGAVAHATPPETAAATIERNAQELVAARRKPTSLRKLSIDERARVLEKLNSSRFVDMSPAQVYATLLDEGLWLCSIRTMYRILSENQQVRERRRQRKHPTYVKPQLLARRNNQVWTWDITKIASSTKGIYFHLYVVIDIYSRYVVGWRAERVESAELARELISESYAKQSISQNSLAVHADRGTSMTSKTVTQLFSDLGILKSHSRPRVSNDNPFSESQFKTLKYRSNFPGQFGSLEDARGYCREFFNWYNTEHKHSGICLLTPQQVHDGIAPEVLAARHQTRLQAYMAHPERFVNGCPQPNSLPQEVWINKPEGLSPPIEPAKRVANTGPSETHIAQSRGLWETCGQVAGFRPDRPSPHWAIGAGREPGVSCPQVFHGPVEVQPGAAELL